MELTLNLDATSFETVDALGNDYDVIIIGGGPAGATAAMYTARAELRTLVIDKGLTAGALGITGKIANYPGILDEISGADLLDRMRQQAESFGANFIQDRVQGVDLGSDPKTIYANSGTYNAQAVIIATGSMGRGQRLRGEDGLLGRGVSYCATCDAAFFRGTDVAVIGSSDEAIEEALFLTRFVNKVFLFSPAPELKAPEHLVSTISQHPKVALELGVSVREIIGSDRVESVRVARRGLGEEIIPVSGAFIYLQGGKPVTDFLVDHLPLSDTGCLRVNGEYQTSLPGVFAVGDVLCDHVKQAVVAAAEGAVAAMAVEKVLSGRKQIAVDWSK